MLSHWFDKNPSTFEIAIPLLLLAHGLDAKHIIKVTPQDNFQAMLDGASPGDEFQLEPGIYVNQDLNTKYGFRVSTHDIKIIGKKSDDSLELCTIQVLNNLWVSMLRIRQKGGMPSNVE